MYNCTLCWAWNQGEVVEEKGDPQENPGHSFPLSKPHFAKQGSPLRATKEWAKHPGYYYVWHRNNKVFMHKTSEEPAIAIQSGEVLDGMVWLTELLLVDFFYVPFNVMSTTTWILPHEFKECTAGEYSTLLKGFHLNTRSARKKSSGLELLFLKTGVSFAAIMVTEMWCTDDMDEFRLPLYNCFFLHHSSGHSSGVSFLMN